MKKNISYIILGISILMNLYFTYLGIKKGALKNEIPKNYVINTSFPIKKEKEIYSSEQIEFLKRMGLTQSKTYNDNLDLADKKLTEYYAAKFNLRFLSEDFMSKFLKEKNLVVGDLANYNQDIPASNIEEFKKNFENILRIDSISKQKFFLRISKLNKYNPGKFLQFINRNEIDPNKIHLINAGPKLEAHDQDKQFDKYILYTDRLKFYAIKYKLGLDDIIVDCVGEVILDEEPKMKIIAPQEYFNMEGKVVNDKNEIITVHKDPAVVLKVPSGWVCLTSWK